ncbi:MAG: DUF7281 domain-containing protein [Bacteroidota bacterium]
MTNENKLTIVFCRLLKRLIQQEKIPRKVFSSSINKKQLDLFVEDGCLSFTTQRTKYVICPNTEKLLLFLSTIGIDDLDAYIEFLETEETTRSEATKIASNSKAKKGRVFNGFFLKSYIPITIKINSEAINLNEIKGIWAYIENQKTLEIDKDITIVGIENTETFTLIERYKHLFEDIKPIFLLRYNNNAYIDWLQRIPNGYVHFGDFDLSAIAIYITEFKNKLRDKNCKFFIPNNIETLISKSNNRKDYPKQLNDNKVKSVNFEEHQEIINLVNIIKSNKRTIEQEILMKLI